MPLLKGRRRFSIKPKPKTKPISGGLQRKLVAAKKPRLPQRANGANKTQRKKPRLKPGSKFY